MDNLVKCIENAANEVKNKAFQTISTSGKSKSPILLKRRTYPLNRSRSKFVVVGLCGGLPFVPSVQLQGVKKDCVTLEEGEWNAFLEQQAVISNYFNGKDIQQHPVQLSNSKRIHFTYVGQGGAAVKVIHVKGVDDDNEEIYLGLESILELWEVKPLIEYGIRMLKLSSLEFSTFYTSIVKGVSPLTGDMKINIYSVLDVLNITSDNVECMLEMVKYCEHIIRCDIEIDQYLQLLGNKE